jgi:hypothetical protein
MERKTPFQVLAYTVDGVTGLMARAITPRFVSPLFTAVHVVPLSVERKRLLFVPAYRVEGVTGSMTRDITGLGTRDRMDRSAIPGLAALHVAPLSVERKRSPEVPAYRVEGAAGLTARHNIVPPYSGSCVQVSVSAARAEGIPTWTPGTITMKHRTRIKTIRMIGLIVTASFGRRR